MTKQPTSADLSSGESDSRITQASILRFLAVSLILTVCGCGSKGEPTSEVAPSPPPSLEQQPDPPLTSSIAPPDTTTAPPDTSITPPDTSTEPQDSVAAPGPPPTTEKPSTRKQPEIASSELIRTRLRKTPELILTVDMEKHTLDRDQVGAPVDAALSPDGKYLAVGGKFTVIRFFDAKTGKFLCRRPDPQHNPALGAQRTLVWVDNRYVVAAGSEHAVWVWDSQNDFKCVKAFRSVIYETLDLAWCPKRRLIAAGESSGVVSVWNFDTAGKAEVLGFGDKTASPQVMAHCVFNPKDEKHAIAVQAVAWSPDGMQLAAASKHGLQILDASGNGPILAFNDKTTMHPKFWQHGTGKNGGMHDMPTVKEFATPGSDAPVDPHCYRVDWSSDGKFVAAGYGVRRDDALKSGNTTPAHVRLFTPSNWKQVRDWTPHKSRVYALKFSPDGSVLASGGLHDMFLWDPATGQKLMTLPPHGDEVTSMRWSDDGKLLVTCAGSERHDSATSRMGHNGTFVSPGKDKKLRVWRVAD